MIKLAFIPFNEMMLLENQSKENKDGINPSNNVLLESSLNTRQIHDPIAINLISRAFRQYTLLIPKAINQKIEEYLFSHDKTINEFHDRIMDKLREITGQRQIFINLYNFDFISNLSRLISNNKERIPFNDSFWYDLERFLFKYALLMRRRFADNDQLFERSVKNIKCIMIIIKKEIGLSVDITLQSMTNFDFITFNNLVKYEIFDHPQLLALFAKNIIDIKGNLIMTINEIEQKYCNQNFNNDHLLRMMLIEFAFGNSANEQMLQRGWITNENIDCFGDCNFAIALHYIYSSKKGEERKSKVGVIESLWPCYLSHSMIRFFLDNNLQFRIDDSSDLVQFLKRLEYIGRESLKGSLIDKIFKFRDENENEKAFKWNKDIFEKYLSEEMRLNRISQKEYNKYIKLIA